MSVDGGNSLGGQQITVWRAPMVQDAQYGAMRRDWDNPTMTVIGNVSVQPIGAAENDIDREYAATHVRLYAPGGVDLVASDRVLYGTRMWEVDGEPAVWYDDFGRLDHVEADLKRMTG